MPTHPLFLPLLRPAPIVALLVGITLASAGTAAAEPTEAATVVMSRGETRLARPAWFSSPVRVGATIRSGDRLSTGKDGRINLRFVDDALLDIQPNTEFRIDDYRHEGPEQRSFMSLMKGAIRTVSGSIGKRDPQDYRLTTPTAVIGIRGTEYSVNEAICPPEGCADGRRNGMRVAVISGRISVTNETGTVEVAEGSSLYVASRVDPGQFNVPDATPPGRTGRPPAPANRNAPEHRTY